MCRDLGNRASQVNRAHMKRPSDVEGSIRGSEGRSKVTLSCGGTKDVTKITQKYASSFALGSVNMKFQDVFRYVQKHVFMLKEVLKRKLAKHWNKTNNMEKYPRHGDE